MQALHGKRPYVDELAKGVFLALCFGVEGSLVQLLSHLFKDFSCLFCLIRDICGQLGEIHVSYYLRFESLVVGDTFSKQTHRTIKTIMGYGNVIQTKDIKKGKIKRKHKIN